MPFGLKNAGATYQRMMNHILKGQIGTRVEAYVDDMVVKTKRGASHLWGLEETFANLAKFDLKLNPTKCAFGVKSHTISMRRINYKETSNCGILIFEYPITIKTHHEELLRKYWVNIQNVNKMNTEVRLWYLYNKKWINVATTWISITFVGM